MSELRELVETECARFGVPGAAVAVVGDGEVLLAEGFGRRNEIEPVTANTLFMLASDTKCFAATTLCLLVERGLLDLDAPVREYLPWFAMHDDSISGRVTSRDLLAHRTGLPRHSLMTIGDGDFSITNEDIARRMRFLEPSRPFRQGFGYSNVHYATAGHVAEVLTGQPWKDLLAESVLAPLGMASTSTYSADLTNGDFAAPHAAGRRLAFQKRDYDLPSGGIVTNANDLTRWLLARLGRGSISDDVLDLLHNPVVASQDALPFPELESLGYALGNLAFCYRGRRLQLHGGSQIGFASQVIVLPDAQVGVAVLTNAHGSALPLALGLTLVDHLLDAEPLPWGQRLAVTPPQPPARPAVEGRATTRGLYEYEGTFHHPAYGNLALAVREGALTASFHGLDDDLRMTHLQRDDWLLSLASVPEMRVPLSFRPTPSGAIEDLMLGVDPELAPTVFQRT